MVNWSAMPGRAVGHARHSGSRSGARRSGGRSTGASAATVAVLGVAGAVVLGIAVVGKVHHDQAAPAAPEAAPTTVTVAAGDGAYGCLLNDGYSDDGGQVEASVTDVAYCRSLVGEPAPGPVADQTGQLVCGVNLDCSENERALAAQAVGKAKQGQPKQGQPKQAKSSSQPKQAKSSTSSKSTSSKSTSSSKSSTSKTPASKSTVKTVVVPVPVASPASGAGARLGGR